MLHPDHERRMNEFIRMANLFEEKRYYETANQILNLAETLKEKQVPKDFLKKLDLLFETFQGEFVDSLIVGQNYRKRCFEEIKGIVFKAIGRMGPDFAKSILTIYPLFQRLNYAKRITGDIAEELGNKRIRNQNVVFHLRCYAYLILVEGIFDELARILYFLSVVSKNNVPDLANLERMTIWKILRELKTKPVFLERWGEKKHIRNSIGHVRIDYDFRSSPSVIHFIDVNEKKGIITYDRNLTMRKFVEIALELEESVEAFIYTFILLKIYDLIVSEKPFQ